MNTTDLFDFSFVDRDRERQIFNNFISNEAKNILWINGKRGVGKTQFILHMMHQNEDFAFIQYNIEADEKDDKILIDFIEKLQSLMNISFGKFVQQEYTSFYDNCGSLIKDLTANTIPSISNIVSILLDVSNYVLTKRNERRETIDVIENYIKCIIQRKKLLICVDNFSRCNKSLETIFLNVFKSFLDNTNCKVCIITTTEDMNDLKKLYIREFLPYIFIDLNGFEDYKFFYQILNPIFSTKFSVDDIKYINQKCEGSPQKLSVIISKLLDKNGIIWNEKAKKANLDKRILQEILRNEYIKYSKDDFNSKQKWVLFSFLCLYEKISIQEVKNLALYIAQKNILYASFTEEIFHEELLKLIEHNQLKSDGLLLYTAHDSDYIDYMDIFSLSEIQVIFSENTYEFLLKSKTLSNREDLICRHMRVAKIEGWRKRNFLYGEFLYQKHQFSDAQKVFDYLLDEPNILKDNQLLLIALNEYELGNYEITIEIIENISIDNFQNLIDKFNLFFYWGKSIYNYTGNILQAIQKLEEAVKFVSEDSKEFVNVQNILQMYYIEIPGQKNKAQIIFNSIRRKYKNLYPEIWSSTMRGCHNYLYDDEALKLLEDAAVTTRDEIEYYYIKTTKGFVYIRMGNIEKAIDCFENSYDNLKIIKRHEASYAANDLAVCYMMKKDYPKAKDILEDALFWNKTNYGKIVIWVHLMICECFLKNKKSAEIYFGLLDEYINLKKPNDSIMLRKVYLNLAVASKMLGKDISYNNYMVAAEKFARNSSSEWRYKVMTHKINSPEPQNLYYQFSDFDPWFIVYAHD